jgi:Uma2 family endonuclease
VIREVFAMVVRTDDVRIFPMRARREATVEDLYQVREGKAELVDGKLVVEGMIGHAHGGASLAIAASLFEHVRRTKRGEAFADGIGYLVNVPHRRSFSPDASFYIGPFFGPQFIEGAPLFAVEVRSQDDYGDLADRKYAQKRADYFAAGTQVVWDVDVLRDGWIRVYRASDPGRAVEYRRGQLAEADPALPGWTFPVGDALID